MTKQKLICDLCSVTFEIWEGYNLPVRTEPSTKTAHGVCRNCQEKVQGKNKSSAQILIDCLRSGLSEKARKEFDALPWEIQAGNALDALEKGVIQVSLNPKVKFN